MKRSALLAALIALAASSQAQQPAAAPAAAPPHVLMEASDLKFAPGPPVLPKGGQWVILSGDPGKAGPYVLRSKIPAGYKIPPHWHPTDEHLTILSGTVALGMGDTFDEPTMKTLKAGGYAIMPAEMRHYLKAKTAVTLQVHGVGPFMITYVNPADDPRNAAPAKK